MTESSQPKLTSRETQSNSTKIRYKERCLLSPYLLNEVLEVLARVITLLKDINEIQIEEEEVKVSLFTYCSIVYLSDSENSIRKFSTK